MFPQGKDEKLKPQEDGTFRIQEKKDKNVYKIERLAGYDISPTFNVKDLKSYLWRQR